jgi:hypothetical protein
VWIRFGNDEGASAFCSILSCGIGACFNATRTRCCRAVLEAADPDPMSAEISKLFGIPEEWVKKSRVAIWMALPVLSGLLLAIAA